MKDEADPLSIPIKRKEEADHLSTLEMNVFPNPSSTRFNVKLPKAQFSRLKLLDLAGREVANKQIDNLNNGELEYLDVRSLENGVYILKAESQEKVLAKMVMIK